MSSIDKERKIAAHPSSDGSELIPAEVQANLRKDSSESPHEPLGAGYRVDDEGIVNNYAIEPDMYDAEYPSKQQQQRYLFLGIAAGLLVVVTIWIAFMTSQA